LGNRSAQIIIPKQETMNQAGAALKRKKGPKFKGEIRQQQLRVLSMIEKQVFGGPRGTLKRILDESTTLQPWLTRDMYNGYQRSKNKKQNTEHEASGSSESAASNKNSSASASANADSTTNNTSPASANTASTTPALTDTTSTTSLTITKPPGRKKGSTDAAKRDLKK
jgi:hypothetical protein